MTPETPTERERIELLAAPVLSTLVDAGSTGIETEQIARKVERDYDSDPERAEVLAALGLLVEHDLALRDDEHWRPTRAALAAARFSF
jgi:hypothetical protein